MIGVLLVSPLTIITNHNNQHNPFIVITSLLSIKISSLRDYITMTDV